LSDTPLYSLVEPFGIDGGALVGLSPERAFTLGVEWALVTRSLDSGDGGPFVVHKENADLLRSACQRRGLIAHAIPSGQGWVALVVDRC